MLEYRVLGGFAVGNGDGELSVGGPRQRRLAAMLLMHRNSVVSVDRLADVVFAGEPTSAAPTTLRSYVARLRRVVEFAGSGSQVVTRAPGYRLEVPDDAVDGARFEAALARARALRARGEADAATRELLDGLGLWRGEAYAEFADETWARGEVQRLAELRLVAFEELADAELGAGRPGEAASLLEGLVAEHPLRESLQAPLMLALYRSGRQVDALRAYQTHRDTLVAELGLEPAPELAALEGRILAHDASLVADPRDTALRGYRLGERLGTGRDGTVFAAQLDGVDRDVVIRVVPEAMADAPAFVRTFDADARRVATLREDGAVPVQDWWREPGAAYVVMRRMRGGTLRDRLQRGPLPGEEAARVLARVGGALVAAAEAGLAHGRLSAECVLFDDTGTAHLGDFPLGTGAGLDGHGDIFALAGLAREMVGGDDPGGTVPPELAAAVAGLGTAARTTPGSAGRASSARPAPDAATLADFVAVAVSALAGAPAPSGPRPNPYKGLRAFDEPDAADFFGRDGVVSEVVSRLAEPGLAGRFALVVGASGSGKSSIVRAGLLPAVRRGAVPGSEAWFVATMAPGKAPFEELADALRLVSVGDADRLVTELAAGDSGLHRVIRRLVPPGGELLLVVDQLEELFTLAPDDQQRRFLDALVHSVSTPESRLRVVATLRADFYDRPLGVGSLAGLTGDATVAVGVMSAAEIESAVVGPAERVGVTVEPALVAELVGAVVHEPAALPSLQFTLTELADRSPDGALTLDAYRDLGGVEGAIAARAEDLYLSLAPDARLGVRRMFEQLLVVGPEGEPTRRRALLADVTAALPGNGAGGLDRIVEVWAQARLLTLDHHPDSRAPTVEVAHEALLREWPRLRDWVAEDRTDLAALAHLRDAAAGWEALDRDPGGLYRGTRLDSALHVAGDRGRVLPPGERAFLDASRAGRDGERRREVRRLRRLRLQLVVLAVALVVSLGAGTVAVGQRDRASDQGDLAEARELAAAAEANLDVDPERSVLLALEALDRAPGDARLQDAEQALHDAVTTSRATVRVTGAGGAVAWSPDGTQVASAAPDGALELTDAMTGDPLQTLTGHDARANGVTFSPDGALLGTTGEDGSAIVWDLATGDVLHRLESPAGRDAMAPSFSPDGSLFAAAWWNEGLVRVLDLGSGRVAREVTAVDHPVSTSFDPQGARMAVAWSGGAVMVVDARTGEVVTELDTPASFDAAWSPDGGSIAVAGEDGRARVYDAGTGRRRLTITAHREAINDIGWSGDSASLVTAAEDGTARVWGVSGDEAIEMFTLSAQDTRSGVAGAAFSPDGDRIVTGDIENRSTIVWDAGIGGDAEVVNLPAAADQENEVRYTSDGRYLVTGNATGGVTVWDARTFEEVRTLGDGEPLPPPGAGVDPGSGLAVTSLEVSPDGRSVAIAVYDGRCCPSATAVRVWDLATGREAFEQLYRPYRYVDELAWSPDSSLLAFSSTDQSDEGESGLGTAQGRVTVVDTSGREVAGFEDEETFVEILTLAFTADGEHLVGTRSPMLSFDPFFGELAVWDWREGTVVRTFETHGERARLSPAGDLLASTPPDYRAGGQAVEVWEWPSGRHHRTLAGHSGAVTEAVFSPDGSRLATASNDGTVRLWDPASGGQLLVLRGHDGPVGSVAFSPDGTRLASSGADGTVRVWALTVDELVDEARAGLTRGLTDDECRQYLHTEACRPT